MVVCAPNTQIKWSDFYELGKAVDALATSFSTRDYIPLASMDHTPWSLKSTQEFEFYQNFEVEFIPPLKETLAGFPVATVKARYISDKNGLSLSLPNQVLKNLADDGNLYCTVTDECWCPTLFKVGRAYIGGGVFDYTLESVHSTPRVDIKVGKVYIGDGVFKSTSVSDPGAPGVDQMSCCQTIPVPEIGDLLNYEQKIIPAAWAIQWSTRPGPTFPGKKQEDVPKCTVAADGVILEYDANNIVKPNRWELSAARRKVTGTLVWPIKKEWMNMLMCKLSQILFSDFNGGAQAAKMLKDGVPAPFMVAGCCITAEDLRYTLVHLGLISIANDGYFGGPGTIPLPAADYNHYMGHTLGDAGGDCHFFHDMPWDNIVLVCKDDDNAPPAPSIPIKVYCQTLTDINTVVEYIAAAVKPFDPFTPCVAACNLCCDNAFGLEVVFSGVEWCTCAYIGQDDIAFASHYGTITLPAALTGAYDLVPIGINAWEVTVPNEITISVCGESYNIIGDLVINIVCEAGVYSIWTYVHYIGPDGAEETRTIFSGVGTVSTNGGDCGTVSGVTFLARNGNATIACLAPT